MVAISGAAEQGGLLRGVAPPGTRIALDGRDVPVASDGRFVLGFDRNATASALLLATLPDGTTEERRIEVARRDWPEERIDGLPQETVTPNVLVMAQIKAEAEKLRSIRAQPGRDLGFAEKLQWPAIGRISGVFGSQRILNGTPHAPHMGTDVAVPEGTPVRAAASGTVRLAEPLYLTGNTVLIDHGFGLTTSYAHLSRLDVKPGQRLKSGDVIGASGMTGRTTGPHLHWGLEWLGVRLDPARAAGPMPQAGG